MFKFAQDSTITISSNLPKPPGKAIKASVWLIISTSRSDIPGTISSSLFDGPIRFASAKGFGMIPRTGLPPSYATFEMIPISPRLPPPYTKCIFLSAKTRPNFYAASMYCGLVTTLVPQNTQMFTTRLLEVTSIFFYLFLNSGCLQECNDELNLYNLKKGE